VASNGVNAAEQQITPSSVQVSSYGKQFTTSITDIPDLTGIPSSTLPADTNYAAAAESQSGQSCDRSRHHGGSRRMWNGDQQPGRFSVDRHYQYASH
jgi:hypothetical protein